ncbi:hypothetical protein [Rhodococcus pyridinivorans]|uniref:hypothetical protein n=1 Tax=Rhodococcus pyridinivorans TaxID=103816 RepID=UPI002078EFB2|nr:hypothetical protein [Rhodococcus pyridinivorans]USI92965.1 hypothetical protein LLA01_24805 [Rhodococcus pyridinivorans]
MAPPYRLLITDHVQDDAVPFPCGMQNAAHAEPIEQVDQQWPDVVGIGKTWLC